MKRLLVSVAALALFAGAAFAQIGGPGSPVLPGGGGSGGAGVSGLTTADGGDALRDNCIVRGDDGKILVVNV